MIAKGIARNDFKGGGRSIWNDGDRGYEHIRDMRDEEQGPEPAVSPEVELRIAREADAIIEKKAACPECDAAIGKPCFPDASGTHYNRVRAAYGIRL